MEDTFATKSDLENIVEHLKEWFIQILDQRLNSVDERFDEMALMVKQGFDAVDQRFDHVETRLDNLEEQNEIRGQQNRHCDLCKSR